MVCEWIERTHAVTLLPLCYAELDAFMLGLSWYPHLGDVPIRDN